MTVNTVNAYLVACRAVFRGHPEMHRIDLYVAHASREDENPVHLYRLANACLDGGSVPLWRQGVTLALTRPHDTTRSVDDRRHALKRLGDLTAWQDVAWPTKAEDLPPVVNRWWDGVEDLSGKTLLVCDLGAYGDALHKLRYAEALSDAVPVRIFWGLDASLVEFVEYNFRHLPRMHAYDLTHGWDPAQTDSRFDCGLGAQLLPRLVGALPPFVPRSAAAPVTWAERTTQTRLGLVWGTQHVNTHLERSIPLGMLAPFFWMPGLEFYSLQVGVRAQEGWRYPRLRQSDVPLESFADTANVIASLDGVVTVDTSVAHLSGSLGVPTLTLLPFPSDVMWGFGDTTPWYPTMRFIRQQSPWDWLSVQAQLKEALESRWWESVAT